MKGKIINTNTEKEALASIKIIEQTIKTGKIIARL